MQVLSTFEMDIETVGGVTYDGEFIWITYIDGEETGIKRLNKTTQSVDRQFLTERFVGGICFDGKDLWGNFVGRGICRIDTETGKVKESLPFPADGFMSGLAWDGTYFWLGNHRQKKIYKIDRDTGAVIRTFDSDKFVTGITWANNQLWHGAVDGNNDEADLKQLRRLDPSTGEIVRSIDYPHAVSGIGWDGSNFWCGDCVQGKIRQVDPERL